MPTWQHLQITLLWYVFLNAHNRQKLLFLVPVARNCQQYILDSSSLVCISDRALGKTDKSHDMSITLGHDIIFTWQCAMAQALKI